MSYKRRYLIRHYYALFGYYTGFSLITKPEDRVIENNAPAVYGRADLCTTHTIPDLPVAWDEAEAREFYERQEPFAWLSPDDKGNHVIAGWVEAEHYTQYDDIKPDWAALQIIPLRDYLKNQKGGN